MKPLNLSLHQVQRLQAHGLVRMRQEVAGSYWVREVHARRGEDVYYRADYPYTEEPQGVYWHKSYHLPHDLSRFNVVAVSSGRVRLAYRRPGYYPFTELERRYLRRFYPTATNPVLAERLGRSESSILNFAHTSGLRKAVDHKPGRFAIAHKPWNTGKKGWSAPGTEATRFKKGNLPQTTCALGDGAITVRQDHKGGPHYQYIRLSLSKWQALHRYNWEQANGPIPQGSVLRCKDGDTLNADPSNWRLLTRAENLRLNGHGEQSAQQKLTDQTVAAFLTKGRPEARAALLQQPEILNLKRLQIKLNRAAKAQQAHEHPGK